MSNRPALAKREKKEIQNNNKKQPRVFAKELFKFKYFRFKCRDAARTIDFYKTCGMVLDFDGEQNSFRHVNANQKDKKVAVMESNHLKKAAKDKEDEENKDESELPQGGPCGRVFALSYPSTSNQNNNFGPRIQLVFEEDKDFAIDTKFRIEKSKGDKNRIVTPKSPDNRSARRYEYLVVYVHMISRLVKKIASKGFDVVLDITTFDNNIKLSIIRDPNGIEVRLLEVPDSYMNDNGKKQWFAKLGYYTIPTSFADKTVQLYESLFQVRIPKPQNTKKDPKEKDKMEKEKEDNDVPVNLRKVGAVQTVKNAMTKGTGFRLVDMEEMVVGLLDSVFYWMGNDMRTAACSVCFTEVANADTGEAITIYEKDISPLISIGFEVPNIETVVSKLRHETKDNIEWDPMRYKMSKSGIFTRFTDEINGLFLDLICTKVDPTTITKKKENAAGKYNAFRRELLEGNSKEDADYAINFNHLKGHARILSDGAVSFTRGYGWELRIPAPAAEEPAAPPKPPKKEAKLLSIVRDNAEKEDEKPADEEAAGKAAVTNTTVKKTKQVLGRTREAEIILIENLLNREKSKSV